MRTIVDWCAHQDAIINAVLTRDRPAAVAEVSRIVGAPVSSDMLCPAWRRYRERLPRLPKLPDAYGCVAAANEEAAVEAGVAPASVPSPGADLEPILLLCDIHAPYHDKRAIDLVLDVARDLHPTHLILLGDAADFYSVSAHSKSPARAQRMAWELDEVNALLDRLDATGACDRVYHGGNHEDRLDRYIRDRAPDLDGVVDGVPGLLRLRQRGWTYVPYKRDHSLGKLHTTHDVGQCGRYSVYRCLDTYQHTVASGHAHRMAYVVEGNATAEVKLSAQFGWLGDVEAIDYMHRVKALKDWALGFGVGYLHPETGRVYLQPVPIVGYTCVVNGKLYQR
jgi:hypothetical protein